MELGKHDSACLHHHFDGKALSLSLSFSVRFVVAWRSCKPIFLVCVCVCVPYVHGNHDKITFTQMPFMMMLFLPIKMLLRKKFIFEPAGAFQLIISPFTFPLAQIKLIWLTHKMWWLFIAMRFTLTPRQIQYIYVLSHRQSTKFVHDTNKLERTVSSLPSCSSRIQKLNVKQWIFHVLLITYDKITLFFQPTPFPPTSSFSFPFFFLFFKLHPSKWVYSHRFNIHLVSKHEYFFAVNVSLVSKVHFGKYLVRFQWFPFHELTRIVI